MFKKEHFLYLFYLALSVALYSPSFDNSLRGDDLVFVEHVTSHPLLTAVFVPSERFAFYRPGAIALFYAEHRMFGSNGGRYLLFNYLLHVLVSVLAVGVLIGFGFARPTALLAGGLFLIGLGHYGKQVMWASTSGPLMSVLLSLLALALAVRWMDRGAEAAASRRGNGRLAVIVAVTAAAAAFHEAGLVTPFLLLVAVRLGGYRSAGRRAALWILSPVVVWGGVVAMAAGHFAAYRSVGAALLDVPQYLLRYLGFAVFPLQGSQTGSALPDALQVVGRVAGYLQLFFGSVVLVLVAAVLVWGGRCLRILSAWVVLATLPFCFIALPKHWLELRYVYYASIPVCGLIAAGMHASWDGRRRGWRVVVVVVAAVLTVSTSYLVRRLEQKYDRMSHDSRFANDQDRVLAPVPVGLVVGGVGIEHLLIVVDQKAVRVAPRRKVKADLPVAVTRAAHTGVDR